MFQFQNTTDKILKLIEDNPGISAQNIANFLFFTRPNVIYHIQKLKKIGRIKAISTVHRVYASRGRPEIGYYSIQQSPGVSIQLLINILHILENTGELHTCLKAAAISRAEKMPDLDKPTKRLHQLILQMNLFGYESRWEVHRSRTCVILNKCPFASILSQAPALCHYDQAFIESVLRAEVTSSRTHIIDPNRPCAFELSL